VLHGLCRRLYISVLDRKYVMRVYQSYDQGIMVQYITGEGLENRQNAGSNELMQELKDDFTISL
jgi:hypothetical protein